MPTTQMVLELYNEIVTNLFVYYTNAYPKYILFLLLFYGTRPKVNQFLGFCFPFIIILVQTLLPI